MKTKREILAANRGRSYSWRSDPAYIMKEGHPNKMMRPSTHKLLDKLRNMTMLKEPGMVNVVIYDLAHHFLYKNGEVVLLGRITADLMHLWSGMVQNEEGKPAYIYGQPENHPIQHGYKDSELDNGVPIYYCNCGDGFIAEGFLLHLQEKMVLPVGFAGVAADVSFVGDSPQEILKTSLDTDKNGQKQLIWDHYPTQKGIYIRCQCGRTYAHEEAWADHVRIRVKRFLLNEFPPIGGSSAD